MSDQQSIKETLKIIRQALEDDNPSSSIPDNDRSILILDNLIKEDGSQKQSGFQVSLFPWIPLSKDTRIPVPADWLITMVEPAYKLKEMYIEDIVKNGNQSDSTDDDTTSTDKSD